MKIVALVGLLLLSVAPTNASPDCHGEWREDVPAWKPTPLPLADSSWILLAMGDGASLRTVVVDPSVELEFLGDGVELAGPTSCNGSGGADFRTVDALITEWACPTSALFERERAYIEALAVAHPAKVNPG